MTTVHAEILYETYTGLVHSDICPPDCQPEGMAKDNYRQLLHACLDEWLDKSNGTGIFYIGDPQHPWMKD